MAIEVLFLNGNSVSIDPEKGLEVRVEGQVTLNNCPPRDRILDLCPLGIGKVVWA